MIFLVQSLVHGRKLFLGATRSLELAGWLAGCAFDYLFHPMSMVAEVHFIQLLLRYK